MLTEYKPNRALRSVESSQLETPSFHTKQEESAVSYRRFHRALASGPTLTSGLCLYIGLLVAPATNTDKVMSNEVGLRLLCFTYIHLFVAT